MKGFYKILESLEKFITACRSICFAGVMGPLRSHIDLNSKNAHAWADEWEQKPWEETRRPYREPFLRVFDHRTCA